MADAGAQLTDACWTLVASVCEREYGVCMRFVVLHWMRERVGAKCDRTQYDGCIEFTLAFIFFSWAAFKPILNWPNRAEHTHTHTQSQTLWIHDIGSSFSINFCAQHRIRVLNSSTAIKSFVFVAAAVLLFLTIHFASGQAMCAAVFSPAQTRLCFAYTCFSVGPLARARTRSKQKKKKREINDMKNENVFFSGAEILTDGKFNA